ncbi:MAG: hypothetical protein JSS82_00005 [Bacteroidetes bacterium]|nr:hypothetical protein [Bacteroidota bacterium]
MRDAIALNNVACGKLGLLGESMPIKGLWFMNFSASDTETELWKVLDVVHCTTSYINRKLFVYPTYREPASSVQYRQMLVNARSMGYSPLWAAKSYATNRVIDVVKTRVFFDSQLWTDIVICLKKWSEEYPSVVFFCGSYNILQTIYTFVKYLYVVTELSVYTKIVTRQLDISSDVVRQNLPFYNDVIVGELARNPSLNVILKTIFHTVPKAPETSEMLVWIDNLKCETLIVEQFYLLRGFYGVFKFLSRMTRSRDVGFLVWLIEGFRHACLTAELTMRLFSIGRIPSRFLYIDDTQPVSCFLYLPEFNRMMIDTVWTDIRRMPVCITSDLQAHASNDQFRFIDTSISSVAGSSLDTEMKMLFSSVPIDDRICLPVRRGITHLLLTYAMYEKDVDESSEHRKLPVIIAKIPVSSGKDGFVVVSFP